MGEFAAYAGLFLTSLLAASVIPMQSEAVLVGLLLTDHSPLLVVTVASVGNVAGAAINWLLGRAIERFHGRKWFPASDEALARARAWYHRYGKWSLLLSWVPVIGDPITLIAGVLREPFPVFLLLVAVAKIGRYLVLAAITLS